MARNRNIVVGVVGLVLLIWWATTQQAPEPVLRQEPFYDLLRDEPGVVFPLLSKNDLTSEECQNVLAKRESVWPLKTPWRQLNILVLAIGATSIKQLAQVSGSKMGEVLLLEDLVKAFLCSGHRVALVHTFSIMGALDLSSIDGFYTERQLIGTIDAFNKLDVIQQFPCRARLLDFLGVSTDALPASFTVRQILTPYPYHTGNDFMGMAIRNQAHVDNLLQRNNKERCVVVWGKDPKYFKSPEVFAVLDALNNTRVLANINQRKLNVDPVDLPAHVENFGSVDRSIYRTQLRKCAILLGVGNPIFGPTALEAIAHGMIFLNPKVSDPPKSPNHHDRITSQHPFLETLGKPYVYPIDLSRPNEVAELVDELTQTLPTWLALPLEQFTLEGVAKRLLANLLDESVCKK